MPVLCIPGANKLGGQASQFELLWIVLDCRCSASLGQPLPVGPVSVESRAVSLETKSAIVVGWALRSVL